MFSYAIEIQYVNVPFPVRFEDEDDEGYERRVSLWETELKDKSLWTSVVIDKSKSPQHMRLDSALFHNSSTGAIKLRELVNKIGEVLKDRQSDKKNELLTVGS